jgi:hypothetical protein
MTKITEQTEVKLDLKGIIKIVVLTATLVGMYYTLQSDIEEAKKMPPAVIDRIEYDLKQQWQTKHIEKLEEKVDEILFWCREVDKDIYKNKKK